MNLLLPGRHHLLTNFQLEYLARVLSRAPATLSDVDGRPLELAEPIDRMIWAITSANHSHTRRNPLPAHRREVAIEEFADELPTESFVYLIDDLGHSPNYAEYMIKKIEVDSAGRFALTPQNTVVACSTPEVIELFERLGYRVLPLELADRNGPTWSAETPWQLMDRLVVAGLAGRDWRTEPCFLTQMAPATRRLYLKYGFGDLIVDLHRQPLLSADGDITATRDYNVYVRSFDEGAGRKYALVRDFVRPGRIVDIGCCTGALIREMTRDDRLRESDFYGIEAARPLFAECQHRKEQGAFANDNVFFYQRDFAAGPIFADNSIATFTTCSLTHEIESYLGRDALTRFLGLLHQQLAAAGRWINLDVVGPDQPDEIVWLWLNDADGRSDDWQREFPADGRVAFRDYLAGLSTAARFLRFAHDFRRDESYRLQHRAIEHGGRRYVELRLADACEFLSKKDYLDNWASEMHEAFCFFSFEQWRGAVEHAGFRVHPASRAFTNDWIVANRYVGRAELFTPSTAGDPAPLPWPPTNMVLVAEKASP